MISELSKNDFYKCSGLVNEQGQLEVKAVIEGVNPGRIFVDNMTSPNSGLIWLGNNDGFFFIGSAENEEFNKEMNHYKIGHPRRENIMKYIPIQGVDNITITEAIESHHWDYPTELISSDVEFINTKELVMIKNPKINSIHANKIVRFKFQNNLEEALQRIYQFYGELPFSWWVPSTDEVLLNRLNQSGFQVIDEYTGLALYLPNFEIQSLNHKFSYDEVQTDEQIRQLVQVSSKIWGYDPSLEEELFKQRKDYIKAGKGTSGYIVCYEEEKAVGYANFRYSPDGTILYLHGSGVLQEYRHKGIYSNLVYKRLLHKSNYLTFWKR